MARIPWVLQCPSVNGISQGSLIRLSDCWAKVGLKMLRIGGCQFRLMTTTVTVLSGTEQNGSRTNTESPKLELVPAHHPMKTLKAISRLELTAGGRIPGQFPSSEVLGSETVLVFLLAIW